VAADMLISAALRAGTHICGASAGSQIRSGGAMCRGRDLHAARLLVLIFKSHLL
jgi:hypothetical protein